MLPSRDIIAPSKCFTGVPGTGPKRPARDCLDRVRETLCISLSQSKSSEGAKWGGSEEAESGGSEGSERRKRRALPENMYRSSIAGKDKDISKGAWSDDVRMCCASSERMSTALSNVAEGGRVSGLLDQLRSSSGVRSLTKPVI
jgi:hypothetical protein